MDPIHTLTHKAAAVVVALNEYNGRAYELMKKRFFVAMSALVIGGLGILKRSNPVVSILSPGLSLAFLFYGKFFLGSDLLTSPDNNNISHRIELEATYILKLNNRKIKANRDLLFVVIGVITSIGLVFKFGAPKPIKIVAIVLSTLVFTYSFVAFPYIKLLPNKQDTNSNTSPPSPPSESSEPSAPPDDGGQQDLPPSPPLGSSEPSAPPDDGGQQDLPPSPPLGSSEPPAPDDGDLQDSPPSTPSGDSEPSDDENLEENGNVSVYFDSPTNPPDADDGSHSSPL